MVLLVLAGIWAAVLIPPALRARAESRPADSISAFRRQLTTLRRTGPRGEIRPDPFLEHHAVSAGPRSWSGAPVHPAVAARRAMNSRSRTLRRRRDVLVGLLTTVIATFVLGFIPALRWAWVAHALADVLLIGYIALLVHQRNLATERDLKVRFLPAGRQASARSMGPQRSFEPALLRRSGS